MATFLAPQERDDLNDSPPAGIYGLAVFARRFIDALLQHADIDEFHFFSRGFFSEARAGEFLASDRRIRLRPLNEFESACGETPYFAIHNPWSPDIGPWIELRNRMSARPIPVTGMIHTVSFASFLPRILATMVLRPRAFDSIVCTSECGRRAMQNWIDHLRREFGADMGRVIDFNGRLDTIPIGLDSNEFRPRAKGPLREKLELPQDRTLLLYFGRFSVLDKMDLAPLLLAFQSALRGGRKVSLVLAGSAGHFGYADDVARLASELGISAEVTIRTNVPAEDVTSYYSASDIFVSPSDNVQETFGQSIIEAMSAGLPVVCSEWDGYREIVVHNETGFLIPTYWANCSREVSDYAGLSHWMEDHFKLGQSVCVDVPQMAAAIAALADNSDLRRRMGDRGRQRAIDVYDWSVVVPQYVELWTELNETAGQDSSYERIQRSWYRPDMFHTFEHYTPHLLKDDTRLRAQSAPGIPPDQSNAGRHGLLDVVLLDLITQRAATEIRFDELCSTVTSGPGTSMDRLRFHVLWLLKYNVLAVVP